MHLGGWGRAERSFYLHICCLETGPTREVSSALYRWQRPKPSPYFYLLLLVYASWVSKGLRISFARLKAKQRTLPFWIHRALGGLGALAGARWEAIRPSPPLSVFLSLQPVPISATWS